MSDRKKILTGASLASAIAVGTIAGASVINDTQYGNERIAETSPITLISTREHINSAEHRDSHVEMVREDLHQGQYGDDISVDDIDNPFPKESQDAIVDGINEKLGPIEKYLHELTA